MLGSNASVLCGLAETLRDYDYRIVCGLFGGRFARDRRYRVFALAGTDNETFGAIGGRMFRIVVLKRDNKRRPMEVKIVMQDGTSILTSRDTNFSMVVYTKWSPNSIDYVGDDNE